MAPPSPKFFNLGLEKGTDLAAAELWGLTRRNGEFAAMVQPEPEFK
jgi:hypothetical protein